MEKQVRHFISSCDVCQRFKYDNTTPASLLQPLSIPSNAWTHVSIDFVKGLPLLSGVDVILIVMDRLTKYAHFMGLRYPYTTAIMAKAYTDHIFKLHSLSISIISDRDLIFTSNFWQELFKM